jgi:tol-pal system protein YbgF
LENVMRFCLVLFAVLFLATPVMAQQSNDNRAVMDRLNQIQRQMDTISRQVYSGNPPPAAISTPTGSDTAGIAAATDERISTMEGGLQQINNRLDEQDYALGQLKQQFDALKSDLDVRFKDIGSKAALDNAASNATTTPDVANAPTPATATATAPAKTDTTAAPAATAESGAAKPLPTDSSAALYDSAFQLLREQKYPEAQNGFQEFLKRYPTDPLAGNAQYWLGETYYVQGKYADAAKIFAQGYKKYPKSSKAPDNLLKLGLSLSQSGKKQDACVTLQQLGTQYSNAAAVIKQRAADEIKKLNCGAPPA